MKALEKSSDKKRARAESILSGVLIELGIKRRLNEHNILFPYKKRDIMIAISLVRSASSFIGGVRNNTSTATTSLLIELTALLAPQPHLTVNEVVSTHEFGDIL